MKILVTGATGFIGRYLVPELASQGHDISVLVRRTSDRTVLDGSQIKFMEGDCADEKSLEALRQDYFDAIYHCAALVEDKDLNKLYKVNVAGTDNICRYALARGIKKLVYLSSVAAVSGNDQLPLTEDLPYNATNLYGLSKLEAESLVLEHRRHGLNVAILRPTMVYGEGEPHAFNTIMTLLRWRLLPVIDGGRHKMHMVYVRNLIQAMLMALYDDRFLEGTFFVADSEVLTQGEIFSIFSRAATGKDPILLPGWMTPVMLSLPILGRKLGFFLKDREYDISRLKSLGYEPKYTAKEGLKRSAEYWLKHQRA
ncbi:MAG: NAD(P)-dependent oxidoreductase [Candidatus Omnitrophica bacterium]|nr:NAD(P)-dependent oxidoreductase [Candidatus Omnitrophota bacterium]